MTPFSHTLTDTEWMSIINMERDGLPPCCANISQLRDLVTVMARTNSPSRFLLEEYITVYSRECTDHLENFPDDHPLRKLAAAATGYLQRNGAINAKLDTTA